ncbi:MAG: CBS domain-containing protein [Gemmatimonadaceae bacterium]
MLRVRDIMTPNVVTIAADRTLREAIDMLVTCKIGGMPVLEGDAVVGVIAAADLLEFESLTPPLPRAQEDDEEPTPLEEIEEDEEWEEGNDAPATFFTDLWMHEGPELVERFAAETQEWDFLSEHTVAEAMSRALCTVPEGMEVSAAAQRMLADGVQRALVMDEDRFSGILTTTDILRAVAERRLSVRQYVFPEKATT